MECFYLKLKVLEELNNFCPKVIDSVKIGFQNSIKDLEFERLNEVNFKSCPDISFDIAVMEKTKEGIVIPLNAG